MTRSKMGPFTMKTLLCPTNSRQMYQLVFRVTLHRDTTSPNLVFLWSLASVQPLQCSYFLFFLILFRLHELISILSKMFLFFLCAFNGKCNCYRKVTYFDRMPSLSSFLSPLLVFTALGIPCKTNCYTDRYCILAITSWLYIFANNFAPEIENKN